MSRRFLFNAARRRSRVIEIAVVLAAAALAAVSAHDFTYGANDSSRLATVECLIDYHTLAIDRSAWFERTWDKIRPRPDGPFYSDKPPVMAILLAAPYQVMRSALGLRAAENKEAFCYLMTLFSSGLAYVVAVWCVFRIGRTVGLDRGWAAALAASFGLATIAPVYTRHVNSSLPTLAAALVVVWNMAALARTSNPKWVVGRLLLIGCLAGFAYALEQPTGGLLLAACAGAAAVRLRRPIVAVWVCLAALPWMVLHHAVVYSYAGTFGPPNAVPVFFAYPGSLFDAHNLTGRWNHASFGDFVAYAFLMLFGVHGFILSNPILLLAVPAAVWVFGRLSAARIETVCLGLWCLGVWLLYAALSNNYGGECCSIRWFVPLLAPAAYWLAVLLRDLPKFRIDFVALSAWGAVLAGYFWFYGPFGAFDFQPAFPYFFGSVQAGGCVTWFVCRAAISKSAAPPR